MVETCISSFGTKFCLRLSDLLLGEERLRFDLLEELEREGVRIIALSQGD